MSDRATIQLVDDDQLVRRLFVRTLEDEGYQVLEATSGAEALALAGRMRTPSTCSSRTSS